MKKLLIALLLAQSANAQVQTDKVAHFGTGYVAGSVSNSIVLINSNGKHEWWKSVGVGIGSGLIIGTGKELYDQWKYGGFDWVDLGSTVLGSTLGSVTIKISINSYLRKSGKT